MTPQGVDKQSVQGVLFAVTAFSIWGVVPLYFKKLEDILPGEVLAHRILWTAVLLSIVLVVTRRIRNLAPLWQVPGVWQRVVIASALISANWLVFLWAVMNQRVLETSLGYFINPLVSVLLGVVFLSERLRAAQIAAVAIAAAAIGYLVIQYGTLPWVSLVLAFSFGLYGFMKKQIALDALNGLYAETLILSPFMLAYAVWITAQGEATFATGQPEYNLLLPLAGPLTLIPLTCFAAGARRVQLSTIGFIQYLAPSISFCLAVFVFHEAFGRAQLITFTLIWISLAIYTVDSLHASHMRRRARLHPVEGAP
jgi:chloramphenicol-sensitive protein RarD